MSFTIEQRVLRVLQYINENPASDLSLDRLAELGLMSRFHWHRVFHAMTGETCAQAVKRIRLNRAASWLINTELPIAQIAASVGYPNIQSFTRTFSDRFGIPPATFRTEGISSPQIDQPLRGHFQMFQVELDQAPNRRVAALLHKGPYNLIGNCFEELNKTATTENLWARVDGMMGIYYDDPNVISDEKLRSHAGLIITDEKPLPDTVEDLTLDESECAVLHYTGPYSAIKVAYDYLYGGWLPNSGREPAPVPPYEIYLNDPSTTEETKLQTDIVLRLAS